LAASDKEVTSMYVSPNFTSKKALKEALVGGRLVDVYQPGLGPPAPTNGTVTLEGPHFPAAHKWYATGTMKAGKLVSVK
jgi:hypothetical protein